MIEEKSLDIFAEKLAKLRELFPEVLSEGKIDFKRLQSVLGEEVLFHKEHYELSWAGKSDARAQIQKATSATLIPTDTVGEADCRNIFIEGENLEVLHVLQRAYFGKIKMIYIDPPYNTGNDSFVYPDDYSERQDEYKKRAGITDENGFLNKQDCWKKNSKENGQFHSVWLSMMYPRLYLARNLLREDGVIFISIDDNEQANLKLLCDEIFGAENFINAICVKAKPSAGASGGGEDKRLKKNVEFLLLYAKNSEYEGIDLEQAFDETDLFKHIDSMKQNGKSWKYTRFVESFGDKQHLKSTVDGDGNEIKIYEHLGYRFVSMSEATKDGISERDFYLHNFNTVFRDTNAQSSIRIRVMEAIGEKDGLFSIEYTPRSGKNKGRKTVVYYKGSNKDQLAWLKDIARYDDNKIFIRGKTGTLWADFNWNNVSKEGDTIFPNGKKPIAFIQRMLSISSVQNENQIVLDFFAGSGTTAHAVLDLNEQDGGNRQFICVQMPEVLDETSEAYKAGYRTIADICKTRITKVVEKIQTERDSQKQAEISDESKQVLGFKSFKLAPSNFKQWRSDVDEADILAQLELFKDSEQSHSENDAMLIELLLKAGLPLTTKVETHTVTGQVIYSVESGKLLFFFDDYNESVKEFIFTLKPKRVVCLNRVFKNNDQTLTNFQLGLKDAGCELQII